MATAEQINDLTALYVGYFNRAPDPAGLEFWINQLDSGREFNTIAADFAASPEAIALYPYLSTPGVSSAASFLTSIYQNLFNREPDAEGLAFWTGVLDSGAVSVADMIEAIIGGAQNTDISQDKTILENKVAAGLDFVETAADTSGFTYDDDAAAAAAAVLDGVDETQASVDEANAETDAFFEPVGNTYTLTTGIDQGAEFTGTELNDTFVALIDDDNTTLTGLDQLDGADGNDNLQIDALTDIGNLTGFTLENIETATIRAAGNVGDYQGSNVDLTALTVDNLVVTQATSANFKADDGAAVTVSGVTGSVAVTGGASQTVTSEIENANIDLSGSEGDVTVTHADQADGAITVEDGANVTITADGGTTGNISVGDSEGSEVTGNVTITQASQGSGDITVTQGADVTITASGAYEAEVSESSHLAEISVGEGPGGDITGAVNIEQNYVSDGSDEQNAGDINVTGGTTVDISINAVLEAADEYATNDFNFATTSVASTGNLTDVTITSTASITEFVVEEVADTGATQTVTFEDLASGASAYVNGLTFTASEDLTAAQVAAAFANITGGGDTQDAGGPVSNGIYSGSWNESCSWSATSSDGAAVTFTSERADPGSLSTSGVDDYEYTAGTNGTEGSETDNTINFGNFDIWEQGDEDSIQNVTVDGFAGESHIYSDALQSITLANGAGEVDVETTATSLDLSLDNVDAAINLDYEGDYVETLNITTSGGASEIDLDAGALTDLTIDASADLDIYANMENLETLTVSGSAAVALNDDIGSLETVTVTGSAGVTLDASGEDVTSVDASGTSGDNTVSIDAANATYAGGSGADDVTLTTTSTDNAVTLGAGDDKLTLATGTSSINVAIDAGTGNDTLVMDAADAAAASSSAAFETKIDGFTTLELNALQQGDGALDVNLANMDDVDYVIVNGGGEAALAGSNETVVVTFQALLSGQSVTVDGISSGLAPAEGWSAADVAALFLGLGGDDFQAADDAVGDTLTFTADEPGDLGDDIAVTYTDAAFNPPTTGGYTEGTAGTQETNTVTFSDIAIGTTIIIDGLTVTATGGAALAADIASAFITGSSSGNAIVAVGVPGYTSAAVGGDINSVDFTSVATTNEADLANTGTAADPSFDKIDGTDPDTEEVTINFGALKAGQSTTITVGASTYTYTAVADVPDTTVSAYFAGISIVGWTNGGVIGSHNVKFTSSSANTNVDNLSVATEVAGFPGTAGIVTTDGGVDAATLEISEMADGGTVELTDSNGENNEVTVSMADASGEADELNVVLSLDDDWDNNFGLVEVEDVETINIFANDSSTDEDEGEDIDEATVNVVATSATAVNVTGNADVELTVSDSVETVDATDLTGNLTFGTSGAAMTVNAGSGDDELYANTDGDVINGNDGDDYIEIADGVDLAMISGGAGVDTFYIDGATTDVNSASEILDIEAGDMIAFNSGVNFVSTQIILDEDGNPDLQNYADAAINQIGGGDMAWFQFNDNTYIVADDYGNSSSFTDGEDQIVKITGLVDLSDASFNTTSNMLEIG